MVSGASLYFKNPCIIWVSASFSVRPNVMSFISCSPAIRPIAASCTRDASGWFAFISGMALTDAPSIIIASHSERPVHFVFPLIFDRKSCFELSLATERDTTWV